MHIVICTPIGEKTLGIFWEQLTQLNLLITKAGHTSHHFRTDGCSMLEMARSSLAGIALRDGADVVFFVDDDMVYSPIDAMRMIEEAHARKALVGGVASQRKPLGKMNIKLLEPAVGASLTMFEGGELVEVAAVGLGIAAIDRSVFERLNQDLPEIHDLEDNMTRPYFMTLIREGWWLGEDTSFCVRLRELNIPIFIDTRARVGHRGLYTYYIEDTIGSVPRLPTLALNFT